MKNPSNPSSQSVIALVSCSIAKGVAAALVQFVYNRGETIVTTINTSMPNAGSFSPGWNGRLRATMRTPCELTSRRLWHSPSVWTGSYAFRAGQSESVFSLPGKWLTCTIWSCPSFPERATRQLPLRSFAIIRISKQKPSVLGSTIPTLHEQGQ